MASSESNTCPPGRGLHEAIQQAIHAGHRAIAEIGQATLKSCPIDACNQGYFGAAKPPAVCPIGTVARGQTEVLIRISGKRPEDDPPPVGRRVCGIGAAALGNIADYTKLARVSHQPHLKTAYGMAAMAIRDSLNTCPLRRRGTCGRGGRLDARAKEPHQCPVEKNIEATIAMQRKRIREALARAPDSICIPASQTLARRLDIQRQFSASGSLSREERGRLMWLSTHYSRAIGIVAACQRCTFPQRLEEDGNVIVYFKPGQKGADEPCPQREALQRLRDTESPPRGPGGPPGRGA